ncbi:MAG: hypothetical protein M0C28_05160 [Candidatus Moduliflexus flocculans]|nr:hypothetical protein [Candidatus Moduliflexus flocculans]
MVINAAGALENLGVDRRGTRRGPSPCPQGPTSQRPGVWPPRRSSDT